jgi:predicted PurR-regulated permease PerM
MASGAVNKMWIAAFFLVALTVLWFSRRVVLLLFAAILIALALTSGANLLRRLFPFLGRKTGLLGVFILLGVALTGFGLLVGPSIIGQLGDLTENLPAVFSNFIEKVQGSPVVQAIQRALPDLEEMASAGPGVGGFFSSTFEAVTSFVFIVFAALFLAASPDLYIRMFIRLFPPRLHEDIGHTIDRVTYTLKAWLLGQFISMAMVGTMTGVALALAGVPLALALGFLAGLGEFIPFVGPILVSIPALLFALSEGTTTFLVVLAIILTIQVLESNVIVPIVQRKAVHLPPAVTLTSMLFLGSIFGLLGLFVAAPLVAVVMVVVEEWHLKRNLGVQEALVE